VDPCHGDRHRDADTGWMPDAALRSLLRSID